jgi:alkylation response protein AidB-like acyl-CoA dehydrogenase
VEPRPSVDETRPVAAVDGCPLGVLADADGTGARTVAVLWAAEALGVGTWCVETASAYANVREQFGRPIGQFQAVKHRCADMLLTLERARAAVWDALRGGDGADLATAAALALAPQAALDCAKACVQVLGGIGFTWEHDVHLYLKRAMATHALVGPPSRWRARVFAQARAGTRRRLAVDLPSESEAARAELRSLIAEIAARPKPERRVALADAGLIVPHWPRPWGREASPIEQLVIDDELRTAGVRRPHLEIASFLLPALIAHGSAELQQRFIPPTMRGEIRWCQLFSEPGAGSDLASLATKASKVDGGWLLTGQKVWTTMAAESDFGLCLARSDPAVAKHEGITCFVVDMRSEGIDIRPLRELTGQAMFNEVFLADVFVPDDMVVGAPGGGWRAARTTLANERVTMGSGASFGLGVEMLLGLVDGDDALVVDEVGGLLAESLALGVLGLRQTVRALGEGRDTAEPGPESSVRKLLGVEHEQQVQETGLRLLGAAGAAVHGDAAAWVAGFLANRCLTIGGGTSEVQRNVIAERLLGLPRDLP